MNSTMMTSLRATQTPLERLHGRFMRAPDHGEGEGGEGDGAGDGEGEGSGTIMGDATIKEGEGEGEGAGEGKGEGEGSGEGEDEGEGSGEGKAKKEGEGEGEGAEDTVPEGDYELTAFKVGEGDDAVEYAVDKELLDDFTPVMKEAKLGVKGAQKLAEKVVPKLFENFNKQQQDLFAATRADWAKDAQADPELGGKNWKATESNVARALDHFVGPTEFTDDKGEKQANPFRVLLNETGLGNHPEMIRAFNKIGKALAEEGILARGGGAGLKPSREEILYPEDAPKQK